MSTTEKKVSFPVLKLLLVVAYIGFNCDTTQGKKHTQKSRKSELGKIFALAEN